MSCSQPPLNSCGENAPLEWETPASILNILWGDIWPRLTALAWTDPNWALAPGPIPWQRLDQILTHLVAIEPNPIAPQPTRFARRVSLVRQHFTSSAAPPPIPLTYVGENGYDFVLSDVGMDLFAPEEPEFEWELFRYYTFRRTGRPSLGIPEYLDGTLAFAYDAPTGPGQVATTLQGLTTIPAGAGGCVLADLGQCLNVSKLPRQEHERDRGVLHRGMEVQFPYTSFLSAVSRFRCWQLEGAVFRAILVDLPRVIAEVWMEKAASFTGPMTYTVRFQPNRSDFRDIFKERIETSLPPGTHMEFVVVAGISDVMVSNRGLRFPPVPDTPASPPNAQPWSRGYPPRNDVLMAIAEGRAGNPVFTDSKRPEREG